MAKYGNVKYGAKRYGYDPGYIIDRSDADLKNKTEKAYMNSADLNRIETPELIKKLHEYGYCADLKYKMWSVPGSEIPNSKDMERIRNNILKLICGFYVYEDTPELPESLNVIDIHKANDVEHILLDLYYQTKNMELHMRECGNCECEGD